MALQPRTLSSAARPVANRGEYTAQVVGPASFLLHGPSLAVELDLRLDLNGPLTGSSIARVTVGAKPPPEAYAVALGDFTGRGSFEGTVQVAGNALRGRFDFSFTGRIDANGCPGGRIAIDGAEGRLKGLRGHVDLLGSGRDCGDYDARLWLRRHTQEVPKCTRN